MRFSSVRSLLIKGVSHVIIDEANERRIHTDFLLAILKLILPNRRDLKLIVLTTSDHADNLANYFFNMRYADMVAFLYFILCDYVGSNNQPCVLKYRWRLLQSICTTLMILSRYYTGGMCICSCFVCVNAMCMSLAHM